MNDRHPFRVAKYILFGLLGIAALVLLAWIVMSLWNCLMPALFGLKTIGYWQAAGLMILFRLLFGGFSGPHGYGHGHCHCHGRMKDRWDRMSPEEREKLQDWMHANTAPASPSNSTPAA